MMTGGWQFVGQLAIVFCVLADVTSANTGSTNSTQRKSKERPGLRLDDIVCETGTTKIIPPHYYKDNAAGWCANAVDETYNDVYNMAYREECRRWMGGALPDRVSATQLEYCYEYSNGTVTYDVGVCCLGVLPGGTIRCFNGSLVGPYYYDYYYEHMNYMINYNGEDLVTCEEGEVCQNLYTYIAPPGNIEDIRTTKGCFNKTECQSVNSETCVNCEVPVPECATCCETAFCNHDFNQYYEYRPSPCPTSPPTYYPCDSHPCQNSNRCDDVYNSTSGKYEDFHCYCMIAWEGEVCNETRSQCTSNQCLNGGVCYDYSDEEVGGFRCNCTAPYVGERCELQNNLTCTNAYNYKETYIDTTSSFDGNCTENAWYRNDNPYVYYSPYYSSYVSDVCKVNVPQATVRILFEMKTCQHDDHYYARLNHHSCCQNRTLCTTSNPCLNGGTCWDWSDELGTGYRCDCPPLFVGDNCEISSNLTCSSPDITYVKYDPYYSYNTPTWNCTTQAWYANGNPYIFWYDPVFEYCVYYITRPSDGHQFIQGVDGQIDRDKTQFEMEYCDYGDGYSRCKYHMCCPGCLSSPCQNGGYCIQVEYNEFVCKCMFGFNGDYCENRLSVCKVTGDPHYRTFDVLKYDYQGICKHNLASVCEQQSGLPQFEVYARSENRDGVTTVSYPMYVETVFKGATVRLAATGATQGIPVVALLNGTQVQIPYKNDNFELYYNGDYVHYVATCGLSIDFDGYWAIAINIPANYAGKMCGMCGDADSNAANDLTLENGTYVGDKENGANIFGDSYVVEDPEQPDQSSCPAPPPPPPCNETTYEPRCGVINNQNGIFASCIGKLPPGVADDYYDECILDACYTQGQSICNTVNMFNEECRSYGAQVSCAVWQPATGCETNTSGMCPSGMTYKCGVSACQPTCADPDAPATCGLPNVDACVCQTGEYLFNGTCTSSCPVGCVDPNHQLQPIGSSWPVPGCSTATCVSCSECFLGAELNVTSNCQSNQKCTNETCVDIPTTPGSTITTTPKPTSAAPNIYPEPYVTMALNGSAFASYTVDSSCSNSFSSDFRNSYESTINRANDAITNGLLCVGVGSLRAVTGSIQFNTLGVDIRVTFSLAVGIQPDDTVTIRGTELCAYDVAYYVQSFSNWRQPIISNIYGCPTVTFNPTRFDIKSDQWSCF